MTEDARHLKLLGVFHFVVAGIALLFAMFPILHLIMGAAMLSGALDSTDGEEIPRFFGWFFVVFAGAWIAFGVAFAITMAVAGGALLAHRHYTFCLVMAGVSCVFMPFGTVLGVFTIIVLMRDPVKELFAAASDAERHASSRASP
jgi:hypothetical protein